MVVGMSAGMSAAPAGAVIHEIVAAYCNGSGNGAFEGSELLPPGLLKDPALAKPVMASGAVGTDLLTTDRPQLKVVSGLHAPSFALTGENIDHPSENCKAMRP